jgi:hypothetical protein
MNAGDLMRIVLIAMLVVLWVSSTVAATLTGSFSSVAQGSNVNLTAEGKLDWIHWGLYSDSSLNRNTIYYTDSLNPISWQVLSVISGSGANAVVTDARSHPQRFYRVQTD